MRVLHAGAADGRPALLDSNPHPSEKEVRVALEGNICRCTGYTSVVEAVELAAREKKP